MDLAFAITTSDANVPKADFGDAPDTYSTLLASNGANHIAIGPMLGIFRDTEADGQPSLSAKGDDVNGTPDDEDGIANIKATGFANGGASVTVTVTNGPAYLSGWIDWDKNGDWTGTGELVVNNLLVPTGTTVVALTGVPGSALKVNPIYSRWRLSTAGGLSYTGQASDGEVEDYNNVECSCLGDINGDGKVNASDIGVISSLIASYGSGKPKSIPSTNPYYVLCGDVNKDGKINASDIGVISGWIASFGSGKPKSILCPHSYP
jgi:hypothetical protein